MFNFINCLLDIVTQRKLSICACVYDEDDGNKIFFRKKKKNTTNT